MLKEYSGLKLCDFDSADMKKNASSHAYSAHLDPALIAEQLKTN